MFFSELVDPSRPFLNAIIFGGIAWGLTGLGAAFIFLNKTVSVKFFDLSLGFTSGVMIAASFWSLLSPAIDLSSSLGTWRFVPPAMGFAVGAIFIESLSIGLYRWENYIMSRRNTTPGFRRATLLISAITVHNIPEGLSIGVLFGAAALGYSDVAAAIALGIGIGIQNIPEGLAVSMPLRRYGWSRKKAFLFGQASGSVEFFAALSGVALLILAQPILPYALAFAAGAMVFLVIKELVPEFHESTNGRRASFGFIVGFLIMMSLDVALG